MKKVLDNLHLKLCNELERVSKEEISTHDQLDIIKDLLESVKNIYKIYKYMDELSNPKEMATNSFMRGNSYSIGNSYGVPNNYGNSMSYNGQYDPNQNNWNIPMSYDSSGKEQIIEELKKMGDKAPNMETKQAILECISKMER